MHRVIVLLFASALVPFTFVSCTCSTPLTEKGQAPALEAETYTSFDGDRFPYQSWVPDKGKATTVLIGFHGIAGASDDYRNLAEALRAGNPRSALYAPDLRGQGRDPLKCRRGDLYHPDDWFRDAHTFNRLVQERHPGARVVWCGESMGSLIALHAFSSDTTRQSPPCDALLLTSPLARIAPNRLSPGKRGLLRGAAMTIPRVRVSLEGISGQRETRVTRDVIHQEQVNHNPWHVPKFTLRLLGHLERLITKMPEQAGKVGVPVLILHSGKDVFSDPNDIASFEAAFSKSPEVKRLYYPESYHLLFYDHEREKIIKEVLRWLDQTAP